MTYLTKEQREVLLKPLQPERVKTRKQASRSLSYLEAWDVRAHLIRVFDFGGYSTQVLSCQMLYLEKPEGGKNWECGFQVTMRLAVHQLQSSWEDGAVGFASLPSRGECADMALKTAMSDALKRCAINLGTQFGLSLYDDGRLQDVVRQVLQQAEDMLSEAARSVTEQEPEGELAPNEYAQPGESEPPDGQAPSELSEMAMSVVAQLREHALQADHARRVLAVAEIKDGASEELLAEVLTLPDASQVTVARLADLVAQGSFLNGQS